MRRTSAVSLVLLILAGGIGASPLHAQGVRFGGLEAWVGYGGWGGEDYDALRVGIRGGGSALVEFSRDWTIGAEGYFGQSDFGFASATDFIFRTAEVDELGANLVVRRYFMEADGPRLFGELRGGWTRLESELIGESFSQDGFTIGPETGLRLPASPSVDILMAVGFTWNSYDDTRLFGDEDPRFETSTSAIRWAIRFAVILGAPR